MSLHFEQITAEESLFAAQDPGIQFGHAVQLPLTKATLPVTFEQLLHVPLESHPEQFVGYYGQVLHAPEEIIKPAAQVLHVQDADDPDPLTVHVEQFANPSKECPTVVSLHA